MRRPVPDGRALCYQAPEVPAPDPRLGNGVAGSTILEQVEAPAGFAGFSEWGLRM